MKILISNGNFKFILGVAAEEAEKRGILQGYIVSGYPTLKLIRIIKYLNLGNYSLIKRFLARKENIASNKIINYWLSEFFIQLGLIIRRVSGHSKTTDLIDEFAFKCYDFENRHLFKKIQGDIYHFRSAYGLESVKNARSNGIITLCDHSIVHPELCEYLVENKGEIPSPDISINVSNYWKASLLDINNADHCIVNSEFVKKTFLNRGYDEDKLHVIYTGIDSEFLNFIPLKNSRGNSKKLELIFIGEFGNRKGADILLEALLRLKNINWRLTIVGRVDPALYRKYNKILTSSSILLLGIVPRLDLANLLIKSDVFIFPTLAEGSARVAYMALACGCYIITTDNCGSVAVDKKSGSIVKAGSISELIEAIIFTSELSRMQLMQYSQFNEELIREKYTQINYGNELHNLYQKILNDK